MSGPNPVSVASVISELTLSTAGALFLISSWYKRDDMGFHGAILFSGSQLGSAFSGLIGAGIQHSLDGAKGLESWRWLFIIEGKCRILCLPISEIKITN